MRLNSSDLYVSRMAEAFDKSIVPELQSPTAKVAAGILQSCFKELLRRERQSPALVSEANHRGMALLKELRAKIDSLGERAAGKTIADALAPETESFAKLATDHEALTAEMAMLSRQLSLCNSGTRRDDSVSDLLRRAAQWEYQLHVDLLRPLAAPVSTKVQSDPLPQATLENFLRSVHPDGEHIKVRNLERAEGGTGKQTYLFTLEDASGDTADLVARKADRVQMVTHGAFVIEREFHLVSALAAAGFPSPKPLWLGKNVQGTDGDFYIMGKLPGKIPGTYLAGAERIPESFLLHLAELLAQLHKIELDKFSDYITRYDTPAILSETIEEGCHRTIAEWRAYSATSPQLPSPVIEYLFDWLSRNVPTSKARPVLVHGDFNTHNILALDGRVSGVLDWECALFGAPELDLAYIRPHISKHIDWDKFVGHYLKAGGRALDLGTLNFYLAFAVMRIMNGLSRAARNAQDHESNDIRLLMIELGYFPEFMRLALEGTQPQT